MPLGAIRIPATVIEELGRHAERAAPQEACGVLLGSGGVVTARVELRNLLAGTFAGRLAFEADPRELLRTLTAARQRGERPLAFYHSHPDAPAELSNVDLAAALAPDGTPWWPGVEQLVVAVRGGRAAEVRRFAWSGRGYVPVQER